MPLPPFTTPVPQPVFLPGMSSINSAPTASPLPVRPRQAGNNSDGHGHGAGDGDGNGDNKSGQAVDDNVDDREKEFPLPRLRLHVEDVGHDGAVAFLTAAPASLLATSVRTVLAELYGSPSSSSSHRPLPLPPTRSITLTLRDMGGVAYTTGSDLDNDHKEVHFSLRHVAAQSAARRAGEVAGVVVHEFVHCFQYNGLGAAPGGLIEGVADWVRLRAGLDPPHWKRPSPKPKPTPAPASSSSGKGNGDGGKKGDGGGAKDGGGGGGGAGGGWDGPDRWDAGYQHTAYFLEYLEGRYGAGTVRRLNGKLRARKYEEKAFWTELLGRPVPQLWQDYKDHVLKGGQGKKTPTPTPAPNGAAGGGGGADGSAAAAAAADTATTTQSSREAEAEAAKEEGQEQDEQEQEQLKTDDESSAGAAD
ncbi:plant basic secretory protein [Xylariaceae sp. FL0804]|nr:plant basic secretory protein [Xylariaceae sp. FL0804]